MNATFNLKEYRQAYYRLNKSKYARRNKAWQASHRKERVQHTLRCRSKNPEKFRQYQKEWREEHREGVRLKQQSVEYKLKMREYCKEHYRKNKAKYITKSDKRRALMAGAAVNLQGIQEWCSKVRSQKTFTCYWCSNRTPRARLHFDHIVPISRGGQHSIENLCASCSKCNWEKGSKLVVEWKKNHGGTNAF